MDYTNDPSSNQHPNAHDYDQLQTINAHLDSSTTVGLTATTAGSSAEIEAGGSPADCGQMISEAPHGRSAMYVRATGNDEYVLTHVLWAP